MYDFSSKRDEAAGIKWMLRKLRNKKSNLEDVKENQHFSLDKAVQTLELRLELHGVLDEDLPKWKLTELENLDDNFVIGLSGINPEERERVDSNAPVPENWNRRDVFSWGQWRRDESYPIKDKATGKAIGYSEKLSASVSPKGGGAPIHIYTGIPKKIKWKLTEIEQKDGISFLIGKAKVCEIDAVSSVPSLPEEISSEETGIRVLNDSIGKDEWQRRVDINRIDEIARFIQIEGNIIANSAILFAPPESKDWITTDGGNVTVNFAFLKKYEQEGKSLYSDHYYEEGLPGDLRPMWLIDGQHRIRGLSRNKVGSEIEIPIIMFTNAFSLAQSAKVFAEINTLQKKLDPLHTLFMQHRFKIKNRTAKRDFQHWDVGNSDTWNSRQNNLSYECAGWLASHESGPLHGRIKILESNKPRYTIIKANSWVDYSRDWFKQGGPYGPHDCDDFTKEEIFQEVENYFQAIVNTCNHSEWSDGANRWSLTSKDKGLIQHHSTARVMLDIYPVVHDKAIGNKKGKLISVTEFEKAVKPLYWVDWRNDTVMKRYQGSGEVPRTSLRHWVEAAIRHGKQYSLQEVMAEDIRSKPGKGFLSPPADSAIKIETPFEWPDEKSGSVVKLTSNRPEHSLTTSRWTIQDANGRFRSPVGGFKVGAKVGGVAELKIKWESWMEHSNWMLIRVEWSNVNPPAAFGERNLNNPNPL